MSKTIALVEWNWVGHHPTYFNHFVLAMEELGYDVLALCPKPDEAEELAGQTRGISGGDPFPRGSTQFGEIRMPGRRFRKLRPRRISAIDWTIRHFKGIEDQVQEWMCRSGSKVDAVFHACIYDRDFEWASWAQPFLNIPWTGLYLHALSYRMPGCFRPGTRRLPCPERMFRGRLCRSIGILDEGIVSQVANHLGKRVVALPDLVDERAASVDEDRILSERLRKFAAGRPIVGLFGHLQMSKGLLTFLQAARLPGASEICFALAGDVLWPTDKGDVARLRSALNESPNLWTHLERIPTEPALNELIGVCDVLAAVYTNFPHSSGIQAKAAALRKPLIVSEGYLMAERTKRFRMGEVVPQENAGALLNAVARITRSPINWVDETKPLWTDYLHEHSFSRFKSSIGELLSTF